MREKKLGAPLEKHLMYSTHFYRVVAQQGLEFYKSRRSTLFSNYDIHYGTDVKKGFEYIGEEHFR